MNKPIYFYLKFLLIIIIIFLIYYFTTALLSSHLSPQKDIKPGVISPTWEDCLDRLNSNPLVKDIRWDEQTKVCSVLQSVNTNNTNTNTISDSLKPCSSYNDSCPVDNSKFICKNGQIQEKPVYWALNQRTGECHKGGCDSIGNNNYCFETELECNTNRKDCTGTDNCSGVTNGYCNFHTGICNCNSDGVRDPTNCSYIGEGICRISTSGDIINKCNPGFHYSMVFTNTCKCEKNI